MDLFYNEMASPLGKLKIIANQNSLVAILWEYEKINRIKLPLSHKSDNHPIIQKTKVQLNEYFRKERTSFDISIEIIGTHFQKQVLTGLSKIAYGQTLSYAEFAKKIGKPTAIRAVANAVGKNPLSILIPCHRIIGSNGNLMGFAGGLENKKILLDLETQADKR